MSNKDTSVLRENIDSIEEKRRKNVMENQTFLSNLKLFNVRDDLKSTVKAVTKKAQRSKEKSNRKAAINEIEIRRSARIQSMIKNNNINQVMLDDETSILLTDDASSGEDDDFTYVFNDGKDKEWKPSYFVKVFERSNPRPVRQSTRKVSDIMQILKPNVGLRSRNLSNGSYISNKLNVAISSDDDN